jgi:ribosome maturation factor RimP
MGIRQIRLNSLEKIRENIAAYKGKKINLVLSNRTSVYGELLAVESNGVIMKNQGLKKMNIAWSDISEMYFDKVV